MQKYLRKEDEVVRKSSAMTYHERSRMCGIECHAHSAATLGKHNSSRMCGATRGKSQPYEANAEAQSCGNAILNFSTIFLP